MSPLPKDLIDAVKQAQRAKESVLRLYLARWSRLRAWGVDMSGISLACYDDPDTLMAGTACGEDWDIRINLARGIECACSTLLHEMAHLARYRQVWGEHRWIYHDSAWRALYIAATEEAIGVRVVMQPRSSYQSLDATVAEAFKIAIQRANECYRAS